MNELVRADYLRIKWPIVGLIFTLAFAGGLFAGLTALDQGATRELGAARAAMDEAQSKVDDIAEEEKSIRENIVQYQAIAAAGLVKGEDRLQMREYFAQLRSQNNLFPINLEIEEQQSLLLKYGELDNKRVDAPGRPISLQTSQLNFTLPLLHENDLLRLIDFLMAQPELLQLQRCSINATNTREPNYLRLNQHFTSDCEMTWYTFHIDETTTAPPQ